jgi:hypothetical protein
MLVVFSRLILAFEAVPSADLIDFIGLLACDIVIQPLFFICTIDSGIDLTPEMPWRGGSSRPLKGVLCQDSRGKYSYTLSLPCR